MIGAEERLQLRLDARLREQFLAVCNKHRVGCSAVMRAAMQCVVESGELPTPEAPEYKVQSQLELFEREPNYLKNPIKFD